MKKMENAKRILAISPHPDDIEIIAGGFISSALRRGADVKLIIVTDGSKGTKIKGKNMKETREFEQLNAAKILGIKNFKFLNLEDSKVPEPRKTMEILMPEVREYSPDLLITNDPFLKYEVHLDHIYTGLAALQRVLFYEFPNIGNGEVRGISPDVALAPTNYPNVIVDISDTFQIKIEALKAHSSQNLDLDWVRKLSEYYGRLIDSNYGEAFKYLYPQELHLNIF